MLVLSRKLNESIIIDDNIRITVVGLRGNQIRIGIEAPKAVKVYREEIFGEEMPAGSGPRGRPGPCGGAAIS